MWVWSNALQERVLVPAQDYIELIRSLSDDQLDSGDDDAGDSGDDDEEAEEEDDYEEEEDDEGRGAPLAIQDNYTSS